MILSAKRANVQNCTVPAGLKQGPSLYLAFRRRHDIPRLTVNIVAAGAVDLIWGELGVALLRFALCVMVTIAAVLIVPR